MSKTRKILDKEEHAARKIQMWYRKKIAEIECDKADSKQIMNGHDNKFHLDTIDPSELSLFIKEVKNAEFEHILKRPEVISLTLIALQHYNDKKEGINAEEAFTIIELSQYAENHGVEHIQFHRMLDDKHNWTFAASSYIEKLRKKNLPDDMFNHNPFSDEKKFFTYLKNKLVEKIKKEGILSYSNVFYEIREKMICSSTDHSTDHRYLYHEHLINNIKCSSHFFTPSFALNNRMLFIEYGLNYIKKVYYFGALKTGQIFQGRLFNYRPASISCRNPKINVPEKVHDLYCDPEVYTSHDEYHRWHIMNIPWYIPRIFLRVACKLMQQTQQDLLPKTNGLNLSAESWGLIDCLPIVNYSILPAYPKKKITSKELYFSLIARGTKLCIEKYPNADVTEIRSKNKTSVAIWIMIMDMVDKSNLWKKRYGIDTSKKELFYDHHLALYRELKKKIL